MNKLREYLLEVEEQKDLDLFEKIKSNPKPDVYDLWAVSEERFIAWRRIHDFPILLNHFDNTLLFFKEWKTDNKLTNEIIIENGEITPFIENKKFSKKDRKLYLTKQKWDDKERIFVSHKKIEGEKKEFGITYRFEFLQTFISYLDWLKDRGKNQEILYINSRHAFQSDQERVFIHADAYAPRTDFELLKMGGIPIPIDGFGSLYRGKKMEFVNLCGLKFNGEIHFGENGNLKCSYCACDNWLAEDFNMPLLKLEHCSVENFKLVDSKLQQWKIYDCNVSGDFINSKLYNVDIVGGRFNPVMQDCKLSRAHINVDTNISDDNFNAYKTFKKIYKEQGDDEIAKYYFIKENEFVRSKLKGWSFF